MYIKSASFIEHLSSFFLQKDPRDLQEATERIFLTPQGSSLTIPFHYTCPA
jgi:hypothetical protein